MRELLLISALLLQGLTGQPGSGVVAGQLTSKDGQSVAGIRISAMAVPESNSLAATASTLVSFVLTDASGRYRLENIPSGRYYIIAGLVDFPTYYPGVSSQSGATVVNVTAGGTVSDINFPMTVPVGVTVSGRVIRTLNPATPAPAFQRVALIGAPNPLQEAPLNSDGSFSFSRVRPGTYNLLVNSAPSITQTPVVVRDQDVTGLEIIIPLTMDVTGSVVVDPEGIRPRFSLTFSTFKGGVNTPGAAMLPTGIFRAQLREGEYRLGWSGLPAGYNIKSIKAGSVDLLANPLTIKSGAAPDPIVVTLSVDTPPPWVKVSGRITGLRADQTPVSYRLTLVGAVLDPLDAPVNRDGTFEFPRVLPGSYTARLTPPVPVAPVPVVVGNKDVDNVVINLPVMKQVTGRVTVEGIPQTMARLSFLLTEAAGTTMTAAAVAQADGSFLVTLPEGERRVVLNVPGFSVKSLAYGSSDLLKDALRISDAVPAELRVTLVPAAPGSGTPAGVPGGVVGGITTAIPGGVLGGILVSSAPPPTGATPPPPPGTQRIAPAVAQANLIQQVQPAYPELARAARVSGTVMMSVVISREGIVESVSVVSGHPLLNEAAIAAVRQWRYRPQILNGQPTSVITTVTVNFSFQ